MTPDNCCAIWHSKATHFPRTGDGVTIDSVSAGGLYYITGTAESTILTLDKHARGRLTNWLANERKNGIAIPTVDSNAVDRARVMPAG